MDDYLKYLKMDTHQICWSIFIIPFLAFYATVELKRSIQILKYNRISLFWFQRIRIWFIRIFLGENKASQYTETLIHNKQEMRRVAIYGILNAVIYVPILFFMVIALVNSLRFL